jgi:hypothetical protein
LPFESFEQRRQDQSVNQLGEGLTAGHSSATQIRPAGPRGLAHNCRNRLQRAVVADALAWTLNIGMAVLAGAAAAGIVQFALSRNLRMANSAGQRVNAAILTHYVLGRMEGRVAEAFRKADENPQDRQARRDAMDLGREAGADLEELESAYAIIDGGPQGFGVDRYEFIVGRENRGRGLTKLVTLEEKLEQCGRA